MTNRDAAAAGQGWTSASVPRNSLPRLGSWGRHAHRSQRTILSPISYHYARRAFDFYVSHMRSDDLVNVNECALQSRRAHMHDVIPHYVQNALHDALESFAAAHSAHQRSSQSEHANDSPSLVAHGRPMGHGAAVGSHQETVATDTGQMTPSSQQIVPRRQCLLLSAMPTSAPPPGAWQTLWTAPQTTLHQQAGQTQRSNMGRMMQLRTRRRVCCLDISRQLSS